MLRRCRGILETDPSRPGQSNLILFAILCLLVDEMRAAKVTVCSNREARFLDHIPVRLKTI